MKQSFEHENGRLWFELQAGMAVVKKEDEGGNGSPMTTDAGRACRGGMQKQRGVRSYLRLDSGETRTSA